MSIAAHLVRIGNHVLNLIAGILIFTMLLYGGYSIWDTIMIYKGAFISEDLLQYKPSKTESAGVSLADLLKINPEVRGWITMDGTHVDYPVLQGETDMEYVNKDVYGEFSISGSIFLDCRNSSDFSDSYNLIYGHHMANGAMFGDVVKFADEDYFRKHKTGTLYLSDGGVQKIALFACVRTDAFDSVIFQPDEQKSGDIGDFLTYIREKSVQYRDIKVRPSDAVIGLSTCEEAETNGRLILFGKLEPEINMEKEGV